MRKELLLITVWLILSCTSTASAAQDTREINTRAKCIDFVSNNTNYCYEGESLSSCKNRICGRSEQHFRDDKYNSAEDINEYARKNNLACEHVGGGQYHCRDK